MSIPALVASNAVVVAGETAISILDYLTGEVLGRDTLPGTACMSDEWNAKAQSGLAAADGRIFVPTDVGLVAY